MRVSDLDTIVAVATAPGEGAIGLVRVSGPQALRIAGRCFRGKKKVKDLQNRRMTLGRFVCRDQDLDEVLVSVMRAPNSYTGEDVVEFNCHGGPLLLRKAVDALVAEGGRLAERGEFTRRAFLNGKIDLTQAEAVADMISAHADLGLQSAYFQLRGGLKHRFLHIVEDLRQSLTAIEAELDFSEDVSVDLRSILGVLAKVSEEMERLISSYRHGKIMRDGAVVTLAGKPNVGKSCLFNRLLEEDRAIVTSTPGTTRDTLEESLNLDGLQVRLIDTAGIRETTDEIEREGTRRSRASIGRAEIVLHVVDASSPPDMEDSAILVELTGHPVVLVLNKIDIGCDSAWGAWLKDLEGFRVSALSGEGIDILRRGILQRLAGTQPIGMEILTHERHVLSLQEANRAIAEAKDVLFTGLPVELAAMGLKDALNALAEIVGETTTESVLDRIFASFCIGK